MGEQGNAMKRQKLVFELTRRCEGVAAQQAACGYLMGETKIDTLYPYIDQLGGGTSWSEEKMAREYMEHYPDQEMERRVNTYMVLRSNASADYYLASRLFNCIRRTESEKVDEFLQQLTQEGLPLKYQLNLLGKVYDYAYGAHDKKNWKVYMISFLQKELQEEREKITQALLESQATGRYFGLCTYRINAADYRTEILAYSQDGSKLVKEELLEIIGEHPEWEEDVLPMLSSKKAAEREFAIRAMLSWSPEKYQEHFQEAMAKEKNAKVVTLLETALHMEGKAEGGTKSKADLVADIHKGGKKRQLAWIYDNASFPPVHHKDGSEAEEAYLQAICLYYAGMSACGVSSAAKELAEDLDPNEWIPYVNEIFDLWLADGAQAKKKWVLYFAAIHGGNPIVDKLKHHISEWPQNMRGAIAAEAVQALALSPLPQALLIVDGISRKFKFRQVKDAAGKALEFAASQLGITKEELADKIVPDLGFDERMERRFDYGERTFTVRITTALEMEISDESGKKIKSMPAPGKKDDEEKAAAAYEEFKQLKKQMKATVTSQKMRLELALSAERLWKTADWKKLFVQNPIMHQFAIGLIWGIYQNHELVQTFRYMEDGSFNTEDEEEYELPEEGTIGLVHPIELSGESIKAWREQLSDYEIKQPIEQLDRAVYEITPEEKTQKCLERFGGMLINDLSLSGKLLSMGWYRGSVQDGGGYYEFYREDPSLGLGVNLNFSGSFVGGGYEEEVTVYDARFYHSGAVERGSYVYDDVDDAKSILLGEIPPRYFSEIILQLTKATAASRERDEDWKKKQN